MSNPSSNPFLEAAASHLEKLGQPVTTQQRHYLDGFFVGLHSKGVSFGDLAPAPLADQAEPEEDLDSLTKEEKIKRQLHPFESFPTLVANAKENKAPEGADVFRFKWNGLFYLSPVKDGFMCRLRIPGGQLKTFQFREIARVAEELTSGYVQITTRNNIQIRLIEPKNAPEVLRRIQNVGLHTRGAGADNVRNITANPTARIDPYELIDVTPFVEELAHRIISTMEFYDLPRKFNIAFDGGGLIGSLEDTNDIGLKAVEVHENEKGIAPGIYFRVALGGVTGHKTFAADMGILVKPDQVLDIICVILHLFIKHGDRTNRKKARLKYLVEKWGIEKYRSEVEAHATSPLIHDVLDAEEKSTLHGAASLPDVPHSHIGIYPQKQDGLFYMGVASPVGQITPQQMLQLADLADEYGSGELRLTVWQNLLIPNVPGGQVEALKRGILAIGLDWKQSNVRSGVVACTGNRYCKYAATDTKGHALELSEFLEKNIELDQPVNIHFTGCPHSCAQHFIGDIGLLGAQTKINGESVDAYHVVLGGGFGENRNIGRAFLQAVPFQDLKDIVINVLQAYQAHRVDGERFQDFCNRHSLEELKSFATTHAQPAPATA